MLYSPVLFYFPSLLCIWRPLPLANKATDEIAEVVLSYCTDANLRAHARARSLSAANLDQHRGTEQQEVSRWSGCDVCLFVFSVQ